MLISTKRAGVMGLALALATLATAAVASPVWAADTTPPTAPTNLRVQNLSFTGVTLAWSPSTDTSGWQMYTAEIRALPRAQQAFGTQGTSRTFTGLVPGLTYTASVWAVDGAGNQSAKTSARFTAPVDTTAPSTPTSLRTVKSGAAVDAVVWSPATDNSQAVTYHVYSGSQLLISTKASRVSVRELVSIFCVVLPGSTHTLSIQARDSSNNLSPRSTPLTVTFPR